MTTLTSSNVADVVAADESFFEALLAADDPALGALLTDDFLIVDVNSGQVVDRTAFLDVVASGLLHFAEVTRYPAERTVRHRDPVAVVVGRTRMALTYRGEEMTTRSRYTHVFVRGVAGWRLLSAQGTPIAEQGGDEAAGDAAR